MGTRSVTTIIDNGTKLLKLYRQFDGYPTGHGAELAQFLSGFTIVNGLTGNEQLLQVANGAGGLAAQLVGHFKKAPGDFYIVPVGIDDHDQDFDYIVEVTEEGAIEVRVNNGNALFKGSVAQFADWCKSDHYDE